VKSWLGKYWLLRLILWLWAAVLCLVIWPVVSWEMFSSYWLFPLDRYELDYCPEFANPFLKSVGGRAIEAWDWETGRRWFVPAPTETSDGYLTVFRNGRAHSLVTVDSTNGLVVTQIAPPHAQRICPIPLSLEGGRTLPLLLDEDLNYLLVVHHLPRNLGNDLHVFELATGDVVGSKPATENVYIAGTDEIEVVEPVRMDGTWVRGEPPIIDVRSKRWRLTSEGVLVASKTPPVTDLKVYLTRHPPLEKIFSPDRRYEAALPNRSGSVYVREVASGKSLDRLEIPPIEGIRYMIFSLDSKHFLVSGPSTSSRVYDLESQTLIASDRHVERRQWYVGVMASISAVCFLLAMVLSLRASSFEQAAWDYLLATVFFETLVTSIGFNGNDWFPGQYTGLGTAIAVGIYWGVGKQTLWVRLVCGTLGITILIGTFVAIVVRSPRLTSSSYLPLIHSLATTPVVCAIVASLITVPFGWRIAQNEVSTNLGRFQWGIGTICVWTVVVAIFSASARYVLSELSEDEDTSAIEVLAGHFVPLFVVCFLVIALVMMLWFRPFDGASAIILIVVGLAVAVGVIQWLRNEMDDLPEPASLVDVAKFALFQLTPAALIVARLCFPLWLARRHGYRWVKVSKAAPTNRGTVEAVA
jgi:hypothetical protein